jgi:serpin B
VLKLVDGNTRFALNLYARLARGPGPVFFSPYSISTALAMTYEGARGETAEEMARTLHFPGPREQLHPAFKALAEQVGGESGPNQLLIANALWAQTGDRFLPEFFEALSANYGAEPRQVDFRRDTEGARRTINEWVEDRTQGKIQELLKPPHLSPLTALVLSNAIYFKGSWASPFHTERTRDEPFHVVEGQAVTAPMMHQEGRFPYFDGGRFQALELPYAGDDLAMVVVLPKETDGLAEVESSLSLAWRAKLGTQRVDVALPRFKLSGEFELSKALSDMGMPLAFTNRADFSGMTGSLDLSISVVAHKAYVDVNEEGTEAAAATAVTMSRGMAISRPVAFRADHPFLFLIRDRRSGSVLFLGRVLNPCA